jgi:hypothetical protein
MSILRHCGLLGLSLILLVGCKVSPPGDTTGTTTNHIELTVSSPHQVDSDSFPNSDVITISARLLDASNNPVKSQLISLSSTLGTIVTTPVLTNDTGYATSTIDPSSTVGAGTITATFGTVTATYNFELLAPNQTPTTSTHITLSLLRNGLPVNRFKSDESVQLQATVADANNVAISNQVVKFAVELGTTDVATALTDANGIAHVNLLATNTTLGAAEATATVTVNNSDLVARLNYEIINSATTVTDQTIKLGHFDSSNTFVENSLGSSLTPDSSGNLNISAGGSLGLSLAIVDENNARIMTPSQVSFTSTCVARQRASIDTGVFTINGIANATYHDLLCSGGQDVVVATVTVNNQTKSISQTVSIAPDTIGSIEFVSAVPESIVLKGTGGLGQQETSTLTFLVKGALGNPLAQQAVTFSLNTSVGNLTLTPASSLTNSAGLVSVKVNAGNVPTSVRVTASITTTTNQIIKTQSDLLSVNTGMPDQDSFSIAPATLNPEADGENGVEDIITARLADSFNNPVPDGTTINFTTEGGSIVPSCNTINGTCSVKWTSAEPRVGDHRITILATAVGHETFYDSNGSNTFDDQDAIGGGAIVSNKDSGFDRLTAAASGFFDMSEAWRDDNENKFRDPGEQFIDFNNNQIFDGPDGKFNGPQCTGNLCGTGINQSLHVRKAFVLVMSGSDARLTLMSNTQQGIKNPTVDHIAGRYVYATNDQGTVIVDGTTISLDEDKFETFSATFADFGTPSGQTLPMGTTIQVSSSNGLLIGTTSKTVGNTIGQNDVNSYNGDEISFTLVNTNTATNVGDLTLNGVLTVTATTPKGTVTSISVNYTLKGS